MRKYNYNIDEFYIGENNKLVVGGWVLLDELYLLKVLLDNKISKEIDINTVERQDVVEVFKISQVMCGFRQEIQLNSLNFKEIKVVLETKEDQIVLVEKEISELLGDEKYIYYNIDSVQVQKQETVVSGWAFTRAGGVPEINIRGSKAEVIRTKRLDVQMVHKHLIDEVLVGFEIKLLPPTDDKIEIQFSEEKFKEIYNLDLKQIKAGGYKQKIKKAIKLLRMCNLDRVKKSIQYARENGIKELIKKIKAMVNGKIGYNEWLTMHLPSKEELLQQREHKFEYMPLISIVVPTYNTPKQFLIEMIESVRQQSYTNWELCIADGNSQIEETICLLKQYVEKDKRIKVNFLNENYGISGNTNECIKLASGEYIGLFDHDDLLTPNALFEVVRILNEEANVDFVYSDEDKTDELGKNFFEPHFKSDWAPDTLRSYNYICHFSVFRASLLKQVGLFRKEYDGSQDHDMILRLTEQSNKIVHIPKILYHWRVHKNSTAGGIGVKQYAIDAGKKAVASHLERMGIDGEVTDGLFIGSYRVKYTIKNNPKVSILIPNKDHKEDLKLCIHSILSISTYKNYEIIIIENNSTTQEIEDYYKELEKEECIKIVRWKGEFNYSAINNFGATHASGNVFVLLNNDIEILTPNWIEEMLMHAQRDEVGIVGAKLYYPDDTIQHAGITVGVLGVAGHNFKHQHRIDPGYFGRSQIVQNLSAVTAACLMIRKDVFNDIKGLDEGFKVAFNDVDFCLRVRETGRLVIFTPYVEAYHYESKSRGLEDTPEKMKRFQGEVDRFYERWGCHRKDPYYNTNLTLEREDFGIRER